MRILTLDRMAIERSNSSEFSVVAQSARAAECSKGGGFSVLARLICRAMIVAGLLALASLPGGGSSSMEGKSTSSMEPVSQREISSFSARLIRFSDDGGWCWFEDERVIVHNGRLVIGTVAAGRSDPSRRGDIEAIIYDLRKRSLSRVELHDRLQLDDHDSPVFLARPDNRLLALYAKHGQESHFYYRISEPNNPLSWSSIRRYAPSPDTRLTYSNIYRLTAEKNRIYNYFRGLDGKSKPSYAYSDDGGDNWMTGNITIQSPAARPYVRYASNGVDTIHLFYTEGHPRDFANSVYHIFYRAGAFHRSDGSTIRRVTEGLSQPGDGTRVFRGDSDHVAWTADVELDERGYPYVAYSVQVGSAELPPRQEGEDHRYRYARWDGKRWHDHAMAFAGRRLYPDEDDYTGLVALHPHNPNVAFISTDADPSTGSPLISRSDGKRHYEIFKGTAKTLGETWTWTAITRDSSVDNLRPIVPKWDDPNSALIWLRGSYRSYTDYDLEVVGLISEELGRSR